MSVVQDYTEKHGDDYAEIGVIVSGPTNRASLLIDLLANLPTSYDTFSLQKIESAELIEGRFDTWRARIRYGAFREKSEMQSGDMEFEFTDSLRTVRRTVSRSSRVFNADGVMDPAPPDANIIGWKPESRQAMGTEDTERIHSFGWTVIIPFTLATETWIRSLGALVGSTNDDTFFGYAAGEVKFESRRGNVRADGEYRLQMSFSQLPNLASLDVGGITVTDIKGWDVIDTPETKFVEENGVILPRVDRVKVHAGPEEKNWSQLATLLGMS